MSLSYSPPEAAFSSKVLSSKEALRALFEPTPLQRNDWLSERYGAEIYLKREDLTPVRSYKLRGAFTFFRYALAANPGLETFVCASAGNHAQGFAFACKHFGKKGVIYMPVTTPQQKIMKTKAFGGAFVEVVLKGDFFDEADKAARTYCQESGAQFVPPFDHPHIIEGQATVAAEIIEQMEGDVPDILVVPVGGGGLAAGMSAYFSQFGKEPVYHFVEPDMAPSLFQSLSKGERITLDVPDNFVDGASVATMGEATLALLARFTAEDVRLIPRDRLCQTMMDMLNVEGVVLEPAGALAIDALRDIPKEALVGKRVVCVASGGNFDFERLAEVKERALKWGQLKKYFILSMPQRPGALKDFLYLLGPEDDIARFEYLKKSARNFGSILIGIETKRAENFEALLARFREANIRYLDITENDILASLLI